MKISSYLSILLLACTFVVGWAFPASTAELGSPLFHKVVTVAVPVAKPAHQRVIKIANAQQIPGAGSGNGCSLPIIVGVAY